METLYETCGKITPVIAEAISVIQQLKEENCLFWHALGIVNMKRQFPKVLEHAAEYRKRNPEFAKLGFLQEEMDKTVAQIEAILKPRKNKADKKKRVKIRHLKLKIRELKKQVKALKR